MGSCPHCPWCCASRSSSLQDDSLPSAEAALILHRKGFDCSLEAKNLGFNCTTSQGKVGPGCPHTSPGSKLGWDLSMAVTACARLSWAQCCPRRHILTWASPLLPQLALGGLFQGLELGSLQPTSLTLMYPLGTASNSTNIHLDPMEIATFRIRLG